MPVLHLRAKPNARRNQLEMTSNGVVTVRLHAPAQDGQANTCLLGYLAEVFGVNKSSLMLLSGHTAPFKKVEIGGLAEAEFRAVLARSRAE
ncbi:DUF167 domain-containing protein [Hymenobacter rubripertinctus]|uniref:UPF0235 protein D0T11_19235 n=1 Tax=Hymenobacter rubripertinctus TaxID=2029981 RepID=A0A418QLM4_9BACT|nr:DUF167 domain-containing protein [Hymenobacter rubripertinctus]RIY06137.1 DUF167 domain-containing protein [Hymenobacter rubripertinctus]